ncbi:MAG: DUF512 domain-containing protein [Fibrobacter sp.]|nr:DUF512 domain-containing protein [Fibrobacter sp.]
MNIRGAKLRKIPLKSPFYKAGLRRSDLVVQINGSQITDELDFRFYAADSFLEIYALRQGRRRVFQVERKEGDFLDLDFYENPINRCCNRCIFCFIDQMPPGLRRGLYIKDEDFKYSFLNGNYVTLSGAGKEDLEKLATLGISPLYVSVHATDTDVRNRMLGNRRAPPILDQLKLLKKLRIGFHTQIVVCRGYNDGAVLKKTVRDLLALGNSLRSIAVVPVGLTRYRKVPLAGFDLSSAEAVCREMQQISDNQAESDGIRKLFIADEFFIKAGLAIPGGEYYEDYPQIENGVGLVRQLLDEWKGIKRSVRSGVLLKEKRLILSSVSAAPFLEKIIKEAGTEQSRFLRLVPVVNKYMGETVTVAGLLSAKDIIRTVKEADPDMAFRTVVLPGVMFNYAGHTLDGYSPSRISKSLRRKILVAGGLSDIFCKGGKNGK